MKKANKKNKAKAKNQTKERMNDSNISDENLGNDLSLSNINNKNMIIEKDDENNLNNNINDEEKDYDLFEKDLLLMDENCKKGYFFEKNYEPSFSINYPSLKIPSIPLFTPSTRLNNALQVGDKNECFIFYYTHKKTLYPTIYNQIIGISGPSTAFLGKEKDFIYANATSIIFTNQRNFINLKLLLSEYVEPLLNDNKIIGEQKENFIETLLNNIHIFEYLSYEELFIKINELNIYLMEHKINNVGLIIVDGINSINSNRVSFSIKENTKNYIMNFNKITTTTNPHKGEQNSDKQKKKNSSGKKRSIKPITYYDNSAIKLNLFGNNNPIRIENNKDSKQSNITFNEIIQESIFTLIMNYQEKYNFNVIITVFDKLQDYVFNLNISGKASYKEMNKNTYTVNTPELQKDNCYFSFKLQNEFFPKKIQFIEPINLCLNYNQNIFGLITNPINTEILEFQVFKKEKNDYRPTRILTPIEYEIKKSN